MTLTQQLYEVRREVSALRRRVERLEQRFGVRPGAPLRLVQGGRA